MKHLTAKDLINSTEIDDALRHCLLIEVSKHPGMRVYSDKHGRLIVKTPGGVRVPAWRLCEVKAMWVQHIEHAPLNDEQRYTILSVLLSDATGTSYIEPLADGTGVSVVMPSPSPLPPTPTKH
jgi:hypothetical protein